MTVTSPAGPQQAVENSTRSVLLRAGLAVFLAATALLVLIVAMASSG